MRDIVQVFQTGTVVKFVEYGDLYVTYDALVSQPQPRTRGLPAPVSVVQRTLYAGYFFASKHVTCDAMKPAPPVTRIALVMSATEPLAQASRVVLQRERTA